eukprot:scaffold389233_cov18-Prasinocladus_malaysianus.AAC.1
MSTGFSARTASAPQSVASYGRKPSWRAHSRYNVRVGPFQVVHGRWTLTRMLHEGFLNNPVLLVDRC